MLLEEIKDLIKDFESVLIKDSRFKEDIGFKNQVKTIYKSEDKYNNLLIHQMSQPVDITPMIISNLTYLGRDFGKEISKQNGCLDGNCEKVIEDLKLSIQKLVKQVDRTYVTGRGIPPERIIPQTELQRVRDLMAENKYTEAASILNRF